MQELCEVNAVLFHKSSCSCISHKTENRAKYKCCSLLSLSYMPTCLCTQKKKQAYCVPLLYSQSVVQKVLKSSRRAQDWNNSQPCILVICADEHVHTYIFWQSCIQTKQTPNVLHSKLFSYRLHVIPNFLKKEKVHNFFKMYKL